MYSSKKYNFKINTDIGKLQTGFLPQLLHSPSFNKSTCWLRKFSAKFPHDLQIEQSRRSDNSVAQDVHEDGDRHHDPTPSSLGIVMLLEGHQLAEIRHETRCSARWRFLCSRTLMRSCFCLLWSL